MLAISDNGKMLWKQLVHSRYTLLESISHRLIETSHLDDEILRAYITTPNSKLSQAAQSWES